MMEINTLSYNYTTPKLYIQKKSEELKMEYSSYTYN